MNKRETLLNLTRSTTPPDYVPAAFFMHFGQACHQGQAAVDKHLEFFRATDMDFVKIQYEQVLPPLPAVRRPEDWAHAPLYTAEFFDAPVRVAEGLVKAAKNEALVIMTLYSPFMWAMHAGGGAVLTEHLKRDPEAVTKGLRIMTENVLRLVRGCKRVGVDGFYATTQGGEAHRFAGTDIFQTYVKPTDLAVWDEIRSCRFNILHICDYEGGYADLTPFLDYPGHVVNCGLTLGDRTLTPKEVSEMFARPFMGGMQRNGVIATGSAEQIRHAVKGAMAEAPDRLVLAAQCTVPGNTPWDNIRTAIDAAHEGRN